MALGLHANEDGVVWTECYDRRGGWLSFLVWDDYGAISLDDLQFS